jgi:hypothetical protein
LAICTPQRHNAVATADVHAAPAIASARSDSIGRNGAPADATVAAIVVAITAAEPVPRNRNTAVAAPAARIAIGTAAACDAITSIPVSNASWSASELSIHSNSLGAQRPNDAAPSTKSAVIAVSPRSAMLRAPTITPARTNPIRCSVIATPLTRGPNHATPPAATVASSHNKAAFPRAAFTAASAVE